jgi:hypothetical protein
MERFEIIIRAEGHYSVWVALLVVALLCATMALVVAWFRLRPGNDPSHAGQSTVPRRLRGRRSISVPANRQRAAP